MLIWEMLHDFLILTTFLLYFFNEGDVHKSDILFKSEKMTVKVYRCFGKDPLYKSWLEVSGIMEHLREKLKSSPQFKTNLATLCFSN